MDPSFFTYDAEEESRQLDERLLGLVEADDSLASQLSANLALYQPVGLTAYAGQLDESPPSTPKAKPKKLNAEQKAKEAIKRLEKVFELVMTNHAQSSRQERSAHYIRRRPTAENHRLCDLERAVTSWQEIHNVKDAGGFRFMPHQRDGIGMAVELENRYHAVLMGDDMGLGKTAQTLALIAINRVDGPTLIVVPRSVISQWQTDIDKFLRLKPSEVLVPSNSTTYTARQMRAAKIVLVTYNRVQMEYEAMRTAKLHFKALATNPSSPILADPSFKPPSDAQAVLNDIFGRPQPEPKLFSVNARHPDCPLFAVRWGRLVLEEGHAIVNSTTLRHEAVIKLESDRRVILSGSPFSNEYTDLLSYFIFFRIEPFNDRTWFMSYFVNMEKDQLERNQVPAVKGLRGAVLHLALKSVMVRRLKTGKFEGEPITEIPKHTYVEETFDFQPVEFTPQEYFGFPPSKVVPAAQDAKQLAINRYYSWSDDRSSIPKRQLLMESLGWDMLDNRMVPTNEIDCQYESRYQWDNDYRRLAQKALKELRAKARADAAEGDSKGKHIKVNKGDGGRGTNMRSWMAASHWAATHAKYQLSGKDEAKIAGSEPVDEAMTEYGTRAEQESKREIFKRRLKENRLWESTKVRKCLDRVHERLKLAPKEKILIFADWLTVLDAVDSGLNGEGVRTLRYDGSVSSVERDQTLEKFRDPDDEIPVLLLTTGAGSEGLNLQTATTVILMSPFWTVAKREQCISRAIRIGQKNCVHVFVYTMRNSFDERVAEISLQKHIKQECILETDSYSGATADGAKISTEINRIMTEISDWGLERFFSEMKTAYIEARTKKGEVLEQEDATMDDIDLELADIEAMEDPDEQEMLDYPEADEVEFGDSSGEEGDEPDGANYLDDDDDVMADYDEDGSGEEDDDY